MSINKYTTAEGLVTLANGSRMWVGTKAAYDSAKQAGTMPNDVLVAITDDSEDNNYSTEEVLTGKFWIDGKPIYRKVLSQNRSGQGDWYFSETISNVEKFIDINTLTHGSNNYQESRDSHYYYTRANLINNTTNTYRIECFASVNYSLAGMQYCIVEYTKTTD